MKIKGKIKVTINNIIYLMSRLTTKYGIGIE